MPIPIGEQVRRARKRAGLTQRELASAAGLTQASISQIENGERPNPGIETIAAIERALSVSLQTVGTMHPSLQRFLVSPLGRSLGITDEEAAGLNRSWFDTHEEPSDEAWYEFVRARRALRRHSKA
jgi:transcriptional regulator with XRE-family HTH domain